ncbi:MAG: sulfatase [Candidatus Cryptobacteroides sp.]
MDNKYLSFLYLGGLALSTCPAGGAEPSAKEQEKQIEARRPNVVFILADQWRKQALGYMGEDPVLTPNLDAMAARSVSFDNAVSSNPVSGPNRACIFTGKYTINNGLWANSTCVDPLEPSAMGKIFKDAGYRTGYIGKWHMNGMDDMVKDPSRRLGFDFWYQSLAHNHFSSWYYAPDIDPEHKVRRKGWGPSFETDLALEFMGKESDSPFCLVVSYAPPHTGGGPGYEDRYQPGKPYKLGYGYAAPEEYEALYQKDYEKEKIRPNIKPTGKNPGTMSYAHAVPGYFGAVTALDYEIGRILNWLEETGEIDNTLIVFTSDHGEMMGSQGLMTKGVPFEESEGVPMLFMWKGRISPSRQSCVFSSIDIIPTLASLAGVACPEVDGTDYSGLLLGRKFRAPEYVFTEFNFGGIGEKGRPWRAVFSEDYVYVLAGPSRLRDEFLTEGYALFDRKNDPYQMNPIVKGMGYDAVIKKYHKVLSAHLAGTGDRFMSEMWNVSLKNLPEKPFLNKENYDPNLTPATLEVKKKAAKQRNER